MTTTPNPLQQGEAGWLHIGGSIITDEVVVPQITTAMLDHPHAGNRSEIRSQLLLIRAGKWKAIDDVPIKCCEGKIKELSICGDGDICIELTPDPSCKHLLREGQETIECELPWGKRNKFRAILIDLVADMRVKICGYHVIDKGHGATIPLVWGGRNELHPVTSIAPL